MKIEVYGYSHSPWVQAVLLALFDKRVEHILYQSPPFEVFKKWGVYMPAISMNDEPWEVESMSILQKFDYDKLTSGKEYSVTLNGGVLGLFTKV